MKEELEAELAKNYPNLYRRHAYIGTGDGWYSIVDDLSAQLEWLTLSGSVSITYTGSKEKFGTLRYDATANVLDEDFPSSIVWALIENAESRSACICEGCGKYGELRLGGWVKTLCERCYEKRRTG